MKAKKLYFAAAAAAAVILCIAALFIFRRQAAGTYERGLFCWDDTVFENRDALFEKIEQFDINSLYQSFPDEVPGEAKKSLLSEAAERRIEVYSLTGSPEWGLDKKGGKMKEKVLEAAELNSQTGGEGQLRGVLMDTEPYLTDEWDEDKESVMEDYVDAMIEAYGTARENNLEFIACIPYHYDSQGLEKELERLVEKGCDGIAIMNYNKRDECGQIETEVSFAEKYGKSVFNIYELQKPGKHDITENNTYYAEGAPGIKESFQEMSEYFGYKKLGYALHDYGALEELAVYE